jgi:pyridoxamine 5'-phosphate oxidase
MRSIAQIRKEYMMQSLDESDLSADPVEQFARWWDNAVESSIDEMNAMTLATSDANGNPSARVVLLKGFDSKGFVFYTNYESRKGSELDQNPRACLVFYWKELERQVRIEGKVSRIDPADSDAYFHSRPEGSRLGAWASPQSKVISGRQELDLLQHRAEERFAGREIPRPSHWGGYLVSPHLVEFWQGRPSRLHDRIVYQLMEKGGWKKERLAP